MVTEFFRQIFRGRFLGHPIHLMLVHFPAALFPFGFAMDLAARFLGEPTFAPTALYSYAGGLLGGFAAAVFGAVDYFRISPEQRVWQKASLHALLNVVWLFAFAFVCGVRIGQYPHFQIATDVQLLVSGISVFGMMISNYLGGDLVIRYGIGTIQSHGD